MSKMEIHWFHQEEVPGSTAVGSRSNLPMGTFSRCRGTLSSCRAVLSLVAGIRGVDLQQG